VNPDVSICIPYFERGPEFTRTLWSFIECGYFSPDSPLKIEVSVCDDGSIDEPVRDLAVLQEIPSGCLRLTELPEKTEWKTCVTPMNTAVGASTAPLIVLQSPETYHPKPAIYHMLQLMEDERSVVTSPTRAPDDPRMKKFDYWYTHPVIRPVHFWWCQMISRPLWEEVGGFDEAYRVGRAMEDVDFIYALKKAGAKMIWADDKEAYTETVFLRKKERHKTHAKQHTKVETTKNPNYVYFKEKWGADAWSKKTKPKNF